MNYLQQHVPGFGVAGEARHAHLRHKEVVAAVGQGGPTMLPTWLVTCAQQTQRWGKAGQGCCFLAGKRAGHPTSRCTLHHRRSTPGHGGHVSRISEVATASKKLLAATLAGPGRQGRLG